MVRYYVVVLLLALMNGPFLSAQSKSELPENITFKNNRPFALVAGGSKGIGYAIAEALAKRKYNLILIARSPNALDTARQKLENTYGIQVEVISQDLSTDDAAKKIAAWCMQYNMPLKMLCNVAGLGGDEDFGELNSDSLRYMMRLNLENPVLLTNELLPLLEKNRPAYILNVASMAGFAPMPPKNIYSATKSGVLYFSYNLKYDLKKHKKGISVSVLAPGPVYTKPKIKETTRKQLGRFGDWMAVPPARVGEIAVKRTLKGRMVIVPGGWSHLASVGIRALPARWAAAIYSGLEKE